MIDAMLLMGNTTVFSPWFPRQADMLRVTAECVARAAGSVAIKLYSKREDETGDGDQVDTTTISLSAVGRQTAEWSAVSGADPGVNELLRFRFEATGAEGGNNDWILFRLMSPVWFDAVEA